MALFKAFQLTSITVAVSLYYTAPILFLIASILFLKEQITARKLLTIGIAFVGSLCVADLSSFNVDSTQLAGVVWALIAAFFYAALTFTSRGIKSTPPGVSAFIQTACGVLLLLAFVDQSSLFPATINWLAVVTLGVLHTGVMYVLFFRSVPHVPAQTIAVLGFIDPAVALLIDRFAFAQELSSWQQVGVVLIFGAVAVNVLTDGR